MQDIPVFFGQCGKQVREMAGLDNSDVMYMFRHLFATTKVGENIEAALLGQMMGDTIETVMKHYVKMNAVEVENPTFDKHLNKSNLGQK